MANPERSSARVVNEGQLLIAGAFKGATSRHIVCDRGVVVTDRCGREIRVKSEVSLVYVEVIEDNARPRKLGERQGCYGSDEQSFHIVT